MGEGQTTPPSSCPEGGDNSTRKSFGDFDQAKNRYDEVDGFDRPVIGRAGGPLHSGLGSAAGVRDSPDSYTLYSIAYYLYYLVCSMVSTT